MNLLQQVLQKNSNEVVKTVFDAGIEMIEKNYVQLGSAQSYDDKNLTVQQRMRAGNLKMLFSMSPSANQAWEKVVSCVMSDGWRVRHKDKSITENKEEIKKITLELLELGLDSIVNNMLWAYGMYGDAMVYTPSGRGTDITKALVPLNNEYLYFDVNREQYTKTGVVHITKYRYQIPPIPGTVNNVNTANVIEYKPEEVMRWSRKTPFNDVTGTAYLEEDQATLILGLRVLNHNLRFFQNSAKPPLVINMPAGTNHEQALEYKKVLDSKYRGSTNVWETMITWNGTEVKELTLPDTTQFYDMLTFVRIQVCGLLNVPPSEVGVVDKNGLNSSEVSHKDFIKTNINSKKRELGRFLTLELLNKRLKHDDFELIFPPMDAINEKQRAETNRVMLEGGQISLDEARELLGRDTINEEWSKELYFGNPGRIAGLIPYDTVDNYDEMRSFSGGSEDKTGSGTEPPKKDGGRPDLDGRDSEPHDGINNDATS